MVFVLVSVRSTPPPPVAPRLDSRQIWLESLDGARTVSFAGPRRTRVLRLLTGSTGLGVAPVQVMTGATPGVAGERVEDVITTSRPVSLPLLVQARDQAQGWAAVQELRDLTDPAGSPRDGSFRIVCASASGTRQLPLVYLDGLEGVDGGHPRFDTFVLRTLAVQPYAEDRDAQRREFWLGEPDDAFLGGMWGALRLSPTTVLGEDMPVVMTSAVPVYPTLSITGPATSALITSDTGLRINVPAGVPAGRTLTIVTDPRRKSIRLNGSLAAGRLARGSRLVPLVSGTNRLDVEAPGATSATRLTLEWRGMHRSLW